MRATAGSPKSACQTAIFKKAKSVQPEWLQIKKPPDLAKGGLFLLGYLISVFVVEMVLEERVSVTWYDLHPFSVL